MNTNKIQQALTLLQEAVDEVPDVTLTLKMTKREADVLLALCKANMSVPTTVVRIMPSWFRGKDTIEAHREVKLLLNKIHEELR